jgi:CelD/BcsL family acetyltransferase involved in cellulose biosynthesis
MIATAGITVIRDFGDPLVSAENWDRLLVSTPGATVFQTWQWQRAWWETFGRGQLLILVAEEEGRPTALWPLFEDGGMVFPVGAGCSDYLDVIGNADSSRLVAMLRSAMEAVPGLLGLRLYHVPDSSPTALRLQEAARRLGLACYDEGDLPCPVMDMAADPAHAEAATRKKSLVRHENYFRRNGDLQVEHISDGVAIQPYLEGLFEQHMERWAQTPYPSLFLDDANRRFYRRLAEVAGNAGWLRFTRVSWEGRDIAYHFGFSYRGRYLWYKPTFAVDLARHSPGEVLIRQILMAAIEEGTTVFDFGIGDEPFKHRFATRLEWVRTWGLYPEPAAGGLA